MQTLKKIIAVVLIIAAFYSFNRRDSNSWFASVLLALCAVSLFVEDEEILGKLRVLSLSVVIALFLKMIIFG